jgi:hypothetical protein
MSGGASENKSGLRPTRREFLCGIAVLGAGATLPVGWALAEAAPVRLGFVGLGSRGRQALASCRDLPGAKVAALCDLRADTLRRAVLESSADAGLFTRDAGRLFTEPGVDAVVLATPTEAQLELAAAACAAGKDVFLLRPLPWEPGALRPVAEEAERRGRQVQVARATGFALAPGMAGGLAGSHLSGAEIMARFQSPERPDPAALTAELIDELDFAEALLGGRMERAFKVGGLGILPGRFVDQRLCFERRDDGGERRFLEIAMIASRGPAVPKESWISLRGERGAAQLAGAPLPPADPLDLGVFFDAVRSRQAGAGLSLQRALELQGRLVL